MASVHERSLAAGRGVAVVARRLRRVVGAGRCVLNDVSLSVRPEELIAIVGGSGAGKTTLLEALAGVRAPDTGTVHFDGVDLYANRDAFRMHVGYVPQDDVIHGQLPLERTLRYAAALRLPRSTPPAEANAAVRDALDALDLADRADVRVDALSGGQRKRASIAVELLTRPPVFFLDEPTSGLDPATGAELLRGLRRLADAGSTVLLTTHAPQDLLYCDRVVFLARDGHLAFSGTVEDACRHFAVDRVEQIYERLTEDTPEDWARRFEDGEGGGPEPPADVTGPRMEREPGPTFLREWTVLSRRTFETLVRNRLTLAILIGSPVLVVAMIAVLFRRGAFEPTSVEPSAVAMILFWVAFGSFFFGLTYGLLQIVTERAILRRERLAGQRLGAYLLSKVAVLLPFLVLVVVLMLAVLRGLGRLPAASADTYLKVGVSLLLGAAAALLLGLWTSAAVASPSQATLALPMLCFPAVLFSGAILPVEHMARAGAAISLLTPDRWVYEALGHDLEIRRLLLEGSSPLGPPLVRSYGDAGTAATTTYWLYLAAFCAVFFVGARLTLGRAVR